jgi:uncharacterized protein YjiS (DUF1127 family)
MTDTEDCSFVLVDAPAESTPGAWDRVLSLALWLEHCLETRRQRRALQMMDNHMLRDIGLSRADVECEANRSFWDAGKR